MPWLSRSNSPNGTRNNSLTNSQDVIHKPPPTMAKVTFIPSMLDGSCGTSPVVYRQTPSTLLWNRFKVMGQNLNCLPKMARSLCTWSILKKVSGDWRSARDLLLQIVLALIELFALIVAIPMLLTLPGAIYLSAVLGFTILVAVLSAPLNGSRIYRSTSGTEREMEEWADEKWIFVNGSMTSSYQLQSQLSHLTAIFCRPMTGVHNRTHGVPLDFFFSLLSHCLFPGANTPTSATLYTTIRDSLLTPSMRKVILLSHGSGSTIMSHTLDKLHADLPIDVLSKLEVYTFGSSATHLSNPVLQTSEGPIGANRAITRADGSIISPVKAALAGNGYRNEDTERVIPHIEHYALTSDISAATGIVHHTRQALDNRLCGRLFLISPTSSLPSPPQKKWRNSPELAGFLFGTHYLESLFPKDSIYPNSRNAVLNQDRLLLDEIVCVDVSTAEKREFTAQGVSMPLKTLYISPRSSMITNFNSNNSGPTSPGSSPQSLATTNSNLANGNAVTGVNGGKRLSWQNGGVFGTGMDCIGQARNSAREAEGKTVRQLSRLWRCWLGGLDEGGVFWGWGKWLWGPEWDGDDTSGHVDDDFGAVVFGSLGNDVLNLDDEDEGDWSWHHPSPDRKTEKQKEQEIDIRWHDPAPSPMKRKREIEMDMDTESEMLNDINVYKRVKEDDGTIFASTLDWGISGSSTISATNSDNNNNNDDNDDDHDRVLDTELDLGFLEKEGENYANLRVGVPDYDDFNDNKQVVEGDEDDVDMLVAVWF